MRAKILFTLLCLVFSSQKALAVQFHCWAGPVEVVVATNVSPIPMIVIFTGRPDDEDRIETYHQLKIQSDRQLWTAEGINTFYGTARLHVPTHLPGTGMIERSGRKQLILKCAITGRPGLVNVKEIQSEPL